MPKDHYVSQVHLRNFYSPTSGRLYAIRKSNLKAFEPDSASVCRVLDGSTNGYLNRPRGVEDFLKSIEPKYNHAVTRLSEGAFDEDSLITISGFISYLQTCSPTAMRLNEEPLRRQLETSVKILGKQGVFSPPPGGLGFESPSEALLAGKLHIDAKFPQAIGICQIQNIASTLASFHWEIIRNPFTYSPFFTSDYPVAIESTSDPRLINKIIPLTPTIAIRIKPHLLGLPRLPNKATFQGRIRDANKQEVIQINRLIVQSAEDVVFFRDNHSWIFPFIKKHRNMRVESISHQIQSEEGFIILSSLGIKPRTPSLG